MTLNILLRVLPQTWAPRARRTGAALATATVLVLTGCSTSSGQAGPASAAMPADVSAGAAAAPEADAALASASKGRSTAGRTGPASAPVAPMLAKKATLNLEVADVADAAARVHAVVSAQGGIVVGESIGSSGEGGRPVRPTLSEREASQREPFGGHGTMTLSVPSAALDATLAELAKVGTVLARNSSSTDVTREVVDTDSRIKTMRASVDRVRALMAQARTVGQIVALESELSRRQADLESLESQLSALRGRVEQATVTVSLATPAHAAAAEVGGFWGGLTAGWNAFVSSGRGLLTMVGAVLPFAVFAALVGLPVVAWRRRRTARTAGGLSA